MSGEGWRVLVDGLRDAGRALEAADLPEVDRADGYVALTRALNNLLGRVESDRDAPELTPFNGWRQKFFMDNPCYRYWITDIAADSQYRIVGDVGESVYQSVTLYAGRGVADATALARIDTDDIEIAPDGGFDVTLPPAGANASSLWVRYVYDSVNPRRPGWCRIETQDADAPRSSRNGFERGLAGVGGALSRLPSLFELAVAEDVQAPNEVRHWSAMAGGAAFTEPGIHYLRGSWRLDDGEALVIDGPPVACRHWNIVLYNRFLNSLDYRHHHVTRMGTENARIRFVLAARDPGVGGYDWLDTEGRHFGLFVLRFLQPAATPGLPTVTRVALDDLRSTC